MTQTLLVTELASKDALNKTKVPNGQILGQNLGQNLGQKIGFFPIVFFGLKMIQYDSPNINKREYANFTHIIH